MSTNNYTTLNMSEINAYRMDGLGNDFIIVDRRENSINLSKEKIIKLGNYINNSLPQRAFLISNAEDKAIHVLRAHVYSHMDLIMCRLHGCGDHSNQILPF